MTAYIFKIITLLGGLALFLFGMDIMGKALERQAGGKLQTILAKMSSNVFKGFLLGLGVTAVIQSSSATTVMVVGFVNSGIMTLKQAVGVIMGSNIGTTVTAWILSLSGLEGDSFLIKFFKPSTLAPLIGIFGILLYMGKSEKKKGIGTIMLGFMALMTGMDLMSSSMAFLKTEAWFADLMISFTNPIVGIIFGAVLTAVIQSSSASVGILQGLCSTGVVTYGAAIPIILGQNIGTCITAIMGAIGANRNARRTAMVHLLFNVVGAVMFAVIFYGLGMFIEWKFLGDSVQAWDISVIHTGFNLIATAVLMPLNGLLVKLAYLLVPEVKEPEKTELLDSRLLATPAVAVQRAHEIASEMAADAAKAMHLAMGLTKKFESGVMEQVVELEDGSLMLNCRNEAYGGKRIVYVTSDMGETWQPHESNSKTLNDPTCQASLVAVETKKYGRLLLFSNPWIHGRSNMSVRASKDEGVTWSDGVLYDARACMGYSCMAMTDPENVGIIYETCHNNGKNGNRGIGFIIIPLDEVVNAK